MRQSQSVIILIKILLLLNQSKLTIQTQKDNIQNKNRQSVLQKSRTTAARRKNENDLSNNENNTEPIKKEYKEKTIINYETFIELLYTESVEEYNGINNDDHMNKLWYDQTIHDWNRAEYREQSGPEEGEDDNDGDYRSPFIICIDSPFLSSIERKKQLLQYINNSTSSASPSSSSENNLLTIKNSKQSTCFIIYEKASIFELLYDQLTSNSNDITVYIQPMSYSMKLLSGSVDLVDDLLHNDDYNDNSGDGRRRLNEENNKTKAVGNVYVDVLLCPGINLGNTTTNSSNDNDNIGSELDSNTNTTKEILSNITNQMNNITNMLNNLTSSINATDILSNITNQMNNITDALLETIGLNASSAAVNTTIDDLKNVTGQAIETIKNFTNNASETLKNLTFGDVANDLGDAFGDMANTVGDELDKLNEMSDMANNLGDGLDKLDEMRDAIGNVADNGENRKSRRKLTSEQDMIRDAVLDHVRSSFETDLYWLTSTPPTGQPPDDMMTIESIPITPRMQFWQDILSISNETTNQEGMAGIQEEDICDAAYEYIDFIFTSTDNEKLNLNLMTLDFTNLITKLEEEGASMTTESDQNNYNDIITQCKTCILKLLLSLSTLHEVCIIQTRNKIDISNYKAQWLVQSGIENDTPLYDLGLTGKNEVIACSDTGIDLDHCYFNNDNDGSALKFGRPYTLDLDQRKVVQYDDYVDTSDYKYGHGTHVAGSIAGCTSDGGGISKGIAYDAKIAFIDIGRSDGSLETPDVTRLLRTGSPYAKIHSASWGGSYPGYGLLSYFFDSYTYYDDDELLVLIAAGNSGSNDASQTVGEPATAKNIIAVGSSHSYGNDLSRGMLGPSYISDFSSRGPTLDGRTKPEIIAPGQWISSAGAKPDQVGECDPSDGQNPGPNENKDGLVSFQGTSMATPILAGTAALIRQYLSEGFYPTGERNETHSYPNPSSALIKAILLNGAQYMKGVDNNHGKITDVDPYDNTQNFGRVSLIDSIFLKDKTNIKLKIFDREIIVDGNDHKYEITIDMSGGCTNPTFTATLVWTDAPALSGCADCLINDIDLFVIKNNDESITYYPNGLSTKDYKNNAERVRIDDVKDNDTFTIYVKGDNILSDVQQYALVATGCFPGQNHVGLAASTGNVYNDDTSAEEQSIWSIISIVLGVVVATVFAGICVGYFFKK